MLDYHLKADNKDAAAKKLDEDMDAYWEKKDKSKSADTEEAEAAGETQEEAKTEEAAASTEAVEAAS